LKGGVLRKRHRGIVVLVAMIMLVIPVAASAAEQTVEVEVLPSDTLSIDVESELHLGSVVPETSTDLVEFWMGITNTTSGGWAVTVSGTDLQAFDWDCDEEENCTRVDREGVTLDASAFFVRGGDQDNWGMPGAIVASEGNLTGAGVPFDLMTGTSDAYGSFGLDDQRPAVQLDIPTVPGNDYYGQYYGTLTYTITGA
jgi:hypothetical protein